LESPFATIASIFSLSEWRGRAALDLSLKRKWHARIQATPSLDVDQFEGRARAGDFVLRVK
jgi:hypothetical protein